MAISCNYNFIHPIQYLYYSKVLLFYVGSQDNTVGILTRQWVGQLRNHDARTSKGKRIFLLQSIKSCSMDGSTSYSVSNGGGILLQEYKWPKHEADYSLPTSVDIKNAWSYTSTFPYAFVACTETTLSFTCCKNYSYTVLHYMSHTLQ